jgi:hypothetical protein
MDFLRRTWFAPAMLPIGLPLLALVAWIPSVLSLRSVSADQVLESFALGSACQAARFQLGWIGEASPAANMGGFTGSLPAGLVSWLTCQLTLHSSLNPPQELLLLGLMRTFSLALATSYRA